MKAILRDDQISKLTVRKEGVEIGSVPRGVSLGRLRFDGKKVVDLVDLDSIWVEVKGGCFILHAIPVRNSTLVDMDYRDRKRLTISQGTIRLKTEEEEEVEQEELRKRIKLHKVKKKLITKVGTEFEQSIINEKLIYIIVKALNQSPKHMNFLSDYLQKMEGFVDIDKEKDTILKSLEDKKNVLSQLNAKNEELKEELVKELEKEPLIEKLEDEEEDI